MIKDRGKTAAVPGIPLFAKFLDVVGAVTPVAPEVISLLLVKILTYLVIYGVCSWCNG